MKNKPHSRTDMGRRKAMKRMVTLAGGATAAWLIPYTADAASKKYGSTPKAAVHYQDHPQGGHHCSNCMHFIPGPSATAPGHCTVVAGSISPHGWCLAWAPKAT